MLTLKVLREFEIITSYCELSKMCLYLLIVGVAKIAKQVINKESLRVCYLHSQEFKNQI